MSFVSLLFSLMAPGAGQIFIGRFAEGLLYGVLFSLGKSAFLPLSLRLFRVTTLKRTLQFFYVCNWGYIVLILGSALAAFLQTKNGMNGYVLYAILFIVCVRLIKKQTFNSFIFTALCGRKGIFNILQKIRKTSTENK